jgi:hypothetical protein
MVSRTDVLLALGLTIAHIANCEVAPSSEEVLGPSQSFWQNALMAKGDLAHLRNGGNTRPTDRPTDERASFVSGWYTSTCNNNAGNSLYNMRSA